MSFISRITAALLGSGPMELPAIQKLSSPSNLGAEGFMGFDDPALAEYFKIGRTTAAGVVVNETMALRNSAIFRAANLICSSMGMLPCHLFKTVTTTVKSKNAEGVETTETRQSAEKATDHALYKILMKRPNNFQTPFEFKSYMFSRALFNGIAYALKMYTINPRVKGGRELKSLIPIDPKDVTPRMTADYDLVFDYRPKGGTVRTVASQDMFWFRSPLSMDGVTGTKLLDVAMETIGLAHQAERASGNVLKNGAIVGGVLEHPKSLDELAIQRLRNQFEDRQSTPENAGKWVVAEDGMEVKPFGSTLKDAQNVEQRKFQIEEVGRFTNVPRPLLFLDETTWGSGIEQLGLFFITYCLLAWFTSFEEAVSRSLLSEVEQDQYYAKFNEAALLRGSLESQASFFSKALGAGGGRGWMTANEVRDKSNMEPKDGGDVLPEPVVKAAAPEGDEGKGDATGSESSPGSAAKPGGKNK